MTNDQLDTIEAQLGFELPGHYRLFMLSYPVELLCERAGNGRFVDNWAFTNLPSRVVQLNRSVRRRGRTFDGEPWPYEYLVIGFREYKCCYCINGWNETVFEMNLDDGKGYPAADSLAAFAQILAAERQRSVDEQKKPARPR